MGTALTTRGRLIALYSPSPRSGKTTVAKSISNQTGAAVLSFAGPLKHLVYRFLEFHIQQPELRFDMVWGDQKDDIIPTLDMTPRDLMIAIGDGMRKADQDIWVKTLRPSIQAALSIGYDVVIDDLRRPNEYQALQAMGAKFWYIERPGVPAPKPGSQEGLLCSEHWDAHIVNKGSLLDISLEVFGLLRR